MASRFLVVGLDQGYSAAGRTSGFLLAELVGRTLRPAEGPHHLTKSSATTRLVEALRDYPIAAASLDAPMAARTPDRYRAVERVFSLGRFQALCKPGSSGAPVGQNLAAACAETLEASKHFAGYVGFNQLGSTSTRTPVVEAFPTAALAVLVEPELLPLAARGEKTDRYFKHLIERDAGVIGGVVLAPELRDIRNHDERMAVVCAVVASWFVLGEYTAVGNDPEGYFLMARLSYWHPEWVKELRRSRAREPDCDLIRR